MCNSILSVRSNRKLFKIATNTYAQDFLLPVVFLAYMITIQEVIVEVRGQMHEVRMRWITNIEEENNPIRLHILSEDVTTHVCNYTNELLIGLCTGAMGKFYTRYPYIQIRFSDCRPRMDHQLRTYKIMKKSGGVFSTPQYFQACQCPMNWPIYLVDRLQSNSVVIAYAKKPTSSEIRLGRQSYNECVQQQQQQQPQQQQPNRPENSSGDCCRRCCCSPATCNGITSYRPSFLEGLMCGCIGGDIIAAMCGCCGDACTGVGEGCEACFKGCEACCSIIPDICAALA